MTAYEAAVNEIAQTLAAAHVRDPFGMANRIGKALMEKRIIFKRARSSPEFLKRFHAHTRYLGQDPRCGMTYDEMKNAATDYAMSLGSWPFRVVPQKVRYTDDRGETIEIVVDFTVKESTTVANNAQLHAAYEYITMTAEELGIVLPEDDEEDGDAE